MNRWLSSLLRKKKAAYQPFFKLEQTLPEQKGALDIFGNTVPDADEQFYPPKLQGISVFATNSIAKHYAKQINQLAGDVKIGSHRQTETGESLFSERYLQVIYRFIEYVHMLPASEYSHHSYAGGLLKHSLETAYLAMRQADEERPQTTRYIDTDECRRPRYIYAAWVAGLLHDTGKLFTDMEVRALSILDKKSKTERPAKTVYDDAPVWKPHIESLITWAKKYNITRYSVEYKKRQHREHDQSSAILLPQILVGNGLEYIVDSPDNLYGELARTLTGYVSESGYLAQMVRTGDANSTTKDIVRMNDKVMGERGKSIPKLVSEQAQQARVNWEFNRVNGHCWVIGNNVFLRWSSAFNSIAEQAHKSGIERLPRKATRFRSMMEDHKLIEPFMNEYPSIHFSPGDFTEERVQRISTGEESVTWEEIIKAAYPALIFGYDPLPGNAEGLILLTQDKKEPEFLIINRLGDIKEVVLKPDNQKQAESKVDAPASSHSPKAEASITQGEDVGDSKSGEDAQKRTPDNEGLQEENKPRTKKKRKSKSLSFINSSPETDKTDSDTVEPTESTPESGNDTESGSDPEEATLESTYETDPKSESTYEAGHRSESVTSGEDDKTDTSISESESGTSESDSETDCTSETEPENKASFPVVISDIKESKAYLSTDATGVHTIDAEVLSGYLGLSPEDIAHSLNEQRLLKKNYSSNTLEEYERIGDRNYIVVRLKRNVKLEDVQQSESTKVSTKKAQKKSKAETAEFSRPEKESSTPKLPKSSSDYGLRLFAHRAEPGTLGFLINETVFKQETKNIVTEKQDWVEINLRGLIDASLSSNIAGHQNITVNSSLDSILTYIQHNDLPSHCIEVHPVEGAIIRLPVKHIESLRLQNVIK